MDRLFMESGNYYTYWRTYIVQPCTEQEGDSDTVGNDVNDKVTKEVTRYTGDVDLGDSYNDHGPYLER